MFPRALSLCRVAAASIVLLTAGRAGAQLAANSPFLPPAGAGANAPTANAPLEYQGHMSTPEGIQYRLYDPAKKTRTWVRLNERNPELGVIAKQVNADNETLTVDHEGRTLTLELKKSKIVSSGSAAQVMAPPPMPAGPNVGPAVTQSVVVNPTPADEARRLEAVAQEVARRRQLREQASQQINQGVVPQVAVPQVQPPQRNLPQQGQQNNPQNQGRRGQGAGRQQR